MSGSDLTNELMAAGLAWLPASLLGDTVGTVVSVLDYGALGNGIHDDTASFNAAATSLANTGGILYVPPGTYVISSAVFLYSNTKMQGARGSILKAAAVWLGKPGTIVGPIPATYTLFAMVCNMNWTAASIIDHDIEVCDIELDATLQSSGGFHNMAFRMVQRLWIHHCYSNSGGNLVSYVATSGTWITDNYVTNCSNCAIGCYEGPIDGYVLNNTIIADSQYGILVTGTDVTGTSSQVAERFLVSGNRIIIQGPNTNGGAGIWLNGIAINAAAAGAAYCRVTNNYVEMPSVGTGTCGIKISGAGSAYNEISNNTLVGGNGAGNAILSGNDPSGIANYTKVIGNYFINYNSGTHSLIQLSGAGDSIECITVRGGTYRFGISLAGTGQFAAHNDFAVGSTAYYALSGSGYTLIEPDKAIPWTPFFLLNNVDIGTGGGVYTQQVGYYYLNGKQVRVEGTVQISNKGTLTGNLSIGFLPYDSNSTVSPIATPFQIGIARNFSVTTPQLVVTTGLNGINFYTDVSNTTRLTNSAGLSNSSEVQFSGTYEIV